MLVHPLSCWCQDLMCQEDSAQHTDTVPADTAPATLLSSVGPYPASGGNSAVCCWLGVIGKNRQEPKEIARMVESVAWGWQRSPSWSHVVGLIELVPCHEASYAAQVHLHGWLLTGSARAVDMNVIEANPPQWPDSVTWRMINYIERLQGVFLKWKFPFECSSKTTKYVWKDVERLIVQWLQDWLLHKQAMTCPAWRSRYFLMTQIMQW